MAVRRGQFFIIGAVIFASLLAGILLLGQARFDGPPTQTPQSLYQHAMEEFPRAVNVMAAENTSPEHVQHRLTTYLDAQQQFFSSHGMADRQHAVIVVPDGSNRSVTIANFRGTALSDLNVSIDGRYRYRQELASGRTVTYRFTDVIGPLQFAAEGLIQTVPTTPDRITGLYDLRLGSDEQVWQGSRMY